MKFRFYKFCQSGVVTVASVLCSAVAVLTGAHGFPWWASILAGAAGVAIGFTPWTAIFYPVLFTVYLLTSVIFSLSNITPFFYVAVFVLVLSVVRFAYVVVIAVKEPSLSLAYDEAIRYGIRLDLPGKDKDNAETLEESTGGGE